MGIERSFRAIESDLVLHIIDKDLLQENIQKASCPVWVVMNKCDLFNEPISQKATHQISAINKEGVDVLLDSIIEHFKLEETLEAPFSTRTRQVDILKRVQETMRETRADFPLSWLIASDLRLMQDTLSEITGK